MYTVNVQRLQQLPCLRLLLPHRLHRLSHHNRSQNTRSSTNYYLGDPVWTQKTCLIVSKLASFG